MIIRRSKDGEQIHVQATRMQHRHAVRLVRTDFTILSAAVTRTGRTRQQWIKFVPPTITWDIAVFVPLTKFEYYLEK